MSTDNGVSPEEAQQIQTEESVLQRGVGAAEQQPPPLEEGQSDFLEALTKTNIRETLDDRSVQLLENLISQDLVLANFSGDEVHEIKWELRIIKKAFFAMHPPADSLITGRFREWVYDDNDAGLEPLTAKERMLVDTFFKNVWARVTRAKNMKQQEMMSKSINESYVKRDTGEDNDSGILNRLRS